MELEKQDLSGHLGKVIWCSKCGYIKPKHGVCLHCIWTPPSGTTSGLGGMDDGGERKEFETGALREPSTGKGRYDLISPHALMRLARWYEMGADKYGEHNWEKGLPVSNCANSLFRHLVKYLAGETNEDHMAAIAWNAFAIMHFESTKPELVDLPSRK